MVSNDDFDGKVTHLNCFYLDINFEQKYPKPAIVSLAALPPVAALHLTISSHLPNYYLCDILLGGDETNKIIRRSKRQLLIPFRLSEIEMKKMTSQFLTLKQIGHI